MKLIQNLFNTPKNPNKILEEVRLQESSLKRRKVELELESRQGRGELDKAIAKAAEAQRKGDAIGRKEAAAEILGARHFVQQVQRDRLINIKSLSLSRIASHKLNSLVKGRGSNQESMRAFLALMDHPDLKAPLIQHDIQVEDFEKKVQVMFNSFDDSQTTLMDVEEDSEIEVQIEQLVKAQEDGNEEEVARLQARLSGEKVECAVS